LTLRIQTFLYRNTKLVPLTSQSADKIQSVFPKFGMGYMKLDLIVYEHARTYSSYLTLLKHSEKKLLYNKLSLNGRNKDRRESRIKSTLINM